MLDRLQEHADTLTEINYRYWTDEFPDDKKIEKWKIKRSRGGQDWVINGRELADAVYLIGANSDSLAKTMELIVATGGDYDRQIVASRVDELSVVVDWLREMLYR